MVLSTDRVDVESPSEAPRRPNGIEIPGRNLSVWHDRCLKQEFIFSV